MIKSRKLEKFKKLSHGFFNRNGGKSRGIYKSLNCGIGSKDKRINVQRNLNIVRKKISKFSKKIFLPNQIHSNKLIFLKKSSNNFKKKFKGDAVLTNQRKLPIGILTADCVPVLIYDDKLNVIGAIHAGWKGAYKDIITKVIKFMVKRGSTRNNINAAIGPCISKKNYNVKKDFYKKFIKKNKSNKIFFQKRNNTIYFDLPNYVKFQLKLNKISNIDLLNIDTFDKKNNYFSARRSLRLKHDDYGRNISIIMLN